MTGSKFFYKAARINIPCLHINFIFGAREEAKYL